MTIAEKVRESAAELKEDLQDTVHRLKEEVAELKDRLLRRERSHVPLRYTPTPATRSPVGRHPRWGLRDPWFDMGWPGDWMQPLEDFTLLSGGWPSLDVTETDREIRVDAELPGVEADDVDITLTDRHLRIRGETASHAEDRRHGYYRTERYYGSFHRVVPLPDLVDREGVETSFRDGVLTIRLPKSEEARKRVSRVPIRTR